MSRLWIVALSLLSNVLALALPLTLIQVYDRILPNQGLGTAAVLFSAVLVALLFDGLARFARSAILARIGSAEEHRLSLQVARHVLTMPRAAFSRLGIGRIDGLFSSVTLSRDILEGRTLMGLFDAPFAIVFLLLVWFLGGAVVLAPLAVIVVIGALASRAARLNKQAVADRFEAQSSKTSLLTAGFAFAELFRTQGLPGQLMGRLRRATISEAQAVERSERQTGKLIDLTQISSLATSVLVLGVGALMVLEGSMTVGALAACLILGQRAVAGLVGLFSGLARRQTAASAYRGLQEALAETKPGSGSIARDEGARTPLGLSWVAPDGRRVEIAPGHVTVVTFPNFGAADAAFSAFYDALHETEQGAADTFALSSGAADEGTPQALASRIAMVRAMPSLFRGTILDNITGFDPSRTNVAMELSEALGLQRSVGRLAKGYQTEVGIRLGAPLSSGAIKRIGLVRALAGRPSLVVLNHPAYALDKDGVDRLFSVLRQVTSTTTIVVLTREEEWEDRDLSVVEGVDGTIGGQAAA
ncbi:ABC transporter transmembrane domain-containing protein [Salipiger bermudensis]|uniref:ABC transporter protein n=1 Tax=Salipiger bermudensis (strain DSM 26914 / JCM 13377 / KCTC 12554 / HTCC2601) TaxID=314265 RepID=Q0FT77_SALBH|nr:ABC transporter transmembrane domain-containing protein [Salipiger bermudensis]EAU47292.1 ABC transporter protein [Salipiger bermudensis HTCC2601]